MSAAVATFERKEDVGAVEASGTIEARQFIHVPPGDTVLFGEQMRAILPVSGWYSLGLANIEGGGQALVLVPIANPPESVLNLAKKDPAKRLFPAPSRS